MLARNAKGRAIGWMTLVVLALSGTGQPARGQDDVESRLKRMEAANAALQAQMEAILRQNAELTGQIRTLKDQLKPAETPPPPHPESIGRPGPCPGLDPARWQHPAQPGG